MPKENGVEDDAGAAVAGLSVVAGLPNEKPLNGLGAGTAAGAAAGGGADAGAPNVKPADEAAGAGVVDCPKLKPPNGDADVAGVEDAWKSVLSADTLDDIPVLVQGKGRARRLLVLSVLAFLGSYLLQRLKSLNIATCCTHCLPPTGARGASRWPGC